LENLGFGLGDTASNFFFQTFNIFLLYYYTDVFGIDAAVAGTMFLLTRLWDAVNDPIMGILADRTHTRWGKYRPYLLWMAIPYGIFGYLIFANPDLGQTGKIVYAYFTYSMMMMAYTAINVPYSSLMGVLSPSSHARTIASNFRFVGAYGGGLIISMYGPVCTGLNPPFLDYISDNEGARAASGGADPECSRRAQGTFSKPSMGNTFLCCRFLNDLHCYARFGHHPLF
jgi:GPH family glycoside/pentoside/hexuronide:cation symporter